MHNQGIRQPIRIKEIVGSNRNSTPVDVNVGDYFPSIKSAAESLGIGRTHIVSQLSGTFKHAKGIVFEYDKDNDPGE